MTRGDLKTGRTASRTAFHILADFAAFVQPF